MSIQLNQADLMMSFKQSESIFIGCAYVDANGESIALPDTIESSVMTLGGLEVVRFDVVIEDREKGKFTLTTADVLPMGSYECDVLFINTTTRLASPTFNLVITHGVTQPSQGLATANVPSVPATLKSESSMTGQLILTPRNGQDITLVMGKYVPVSNSTGSSLTARELVSTDTPNALTLGSDGKLKMQNADELLTNTDFVANINALWIT